MHIRPLLATWGADWNLLGPPVWLLFGIGLVGALLNSRFIVIPIHIKRRLFLIFPGVMLLGCVFTVWLGMSSLNFLGVRYFYKFYYVHVQVASMVSLAFAIGFTLDLLRIKDATFNIVGWVYSFFCLGWLALELWWIYDLWQ